MWQLTNPGKVFEHSIKESAEKQNIFFFRVRDIFVPPEYRDKIRVLPNKYDNLIFSQGILIPMELKSTKSRSVSFKEKILKQKQIDSLAEATSYECVTPGFLLNFRAYQKTYFVHINDFTEYKAIAEGGTPTRTYQAKINKASISMDIATEIGIEVDSHLLRTHYRYDIAKLVTDIKEKYHNEDKGN